MAPNPDWKSADEQTAPANPQFGWSGNLILEQRALEGLRDSHPFAMRAKAADEFDTNSLVAWNKFQQSKGRYPGSCDWTLLDQYVLAGKDLSWLPQIIGSCVVSNTLPGLVERTDFACPPWRLDPGVPG